MRREAVKTTTALPESCERVGHDTLWTSNFSTGREARTPDTRFWRPMLYQLSYSRKNSSRKLIRELLFFISKTIRLFISQGFQ